MPSLLAHDLELGSELRSFRPFRSDPPVIVTVQSFRSKHFSHFPLIVVLSLALSRSLSASLHCPHIWLSGSFLVHLCLLILALHRTGLLSPLYFKLSYCKFAIHCQGGYERHAEPGLLAGGLSGLIFTGALRCADALYWNKIERQFGPSEREFSNCARQVTCRRTPTQPAQL